MVAVITNHQVGEIADPKLRKLLKRVVREMELSIEKVAANHAKPNEFPLSSDPNSTERILATRFNSLPQEFKGRSGAKVLSAINNSVAHNRRFGDLEAVDLKVETPVGVQVRALSLPAQMKISNEEWRLMLKRNDNDDGGSGGGGGSTPTPSGPPRPKLELRLHKAKCLDETGGSFAERFGNDEIDLGGTAVDESGDTHVIPKFRVGSDFDDGDVVNFSPPRSFTTFDLTEGTVFPKSYFVTLALAEVDEGGLAEFLNKLLEKVREKVIAALTAALGSAIGASGGPVGAIIGAAVGFVVGKVFEFIKTVWDDDIFNPVTVSVNIPSLNHRWPGNATDSPEAIATFVGHDGKYEVTYDWRIFA
jgi:hypothetical protein